MKAMRGIEWMKEAGYIKGWIATVMGEGVLFTLLDHLPITIFS